MYEAFFVFLLIILALGLLKSLSDTAPRKGIAASPGAGKEPGKYED